MERKKYAVILAGGSGVRMGAAVPKQFLEIDGKPILRHTVERFLEYDPKMEILIVLPSAFKSHWHNYCAEHGFLERYTMPTGGLTRFHSVQNALKYVPEGALVAVHDGVRPCLSAEFLAGLFSRMDRCEALVPVVPVEESLREVEGSSSFAVDRSRYVRVQTPQVFRSEILKAAYSQAYNPSFTDDASVVEATGCRITLCEGLRENIKITTPADMLTARMFLEKQGR